MNMRINEGILPERSIGGAIRAVEIQTERRRALEGAEAQEKRNRFFHLLDESAASIFCGVETAAQGGERRFYLGTVRGFEKECDGIFGHGLGTFSAGLVNEWLYARDLKHLFHADGLAIEW